MKIYGSLNMHKSRKVIDMISSSDSNINKFSNNSNNGLLPRTADDHKHNTGIRASSSMRIESDSMGDIEVPADHYWGAQTQRSLVHFSIGDDHMPKAVYHAYGYVKKAAALVNAAAGRLPQWKANAIVRAADEAIEGRLDEHFP